MREEKLWEGAQTVKLVKGKLSRGGKKGIWKWKGKTRKSLVPISLEGGGIFCG